MATRNLKIIYQTKGSQRAVAACKKALEILDALPNTGPLDIELELKKKVGQGTVEMIRPGVFRPIDNWGNPERKR